MSSKAVQVIHLDPVVSSSIKDTNPDSNILISIKEEEKKIEKQLYSVQMSSKK